jgi:hypothetical protein
MKINGYEIPSEHYPLVVQQSRYSGVYEGGHFFCYSGSAPLPDAYLDYLEGDDCDALDFWASEEAKRFGVGNSPNDALADFCKKNSFQATESTEYKQIVSGFEARILADRHSIESIERTDYYQISQPIFVPRKKSEF